MKIRMFLFVLIFPFAFSCRQNTTAQIVNNFEFIDYSQFVEDYKNNPDYEILRLKYNLGFIALLDTTVQYNFTNFQSDGDFALDGHNESIRDCSSSRAFVTDSENLEKLLLSNELEARLISCCYSMMDNRDLRFKLGRTIYLNNNVAICEIYGPTSKDVYYIKLQDNGIVRIFWLEGVSE